MTFRILIAENHILMREGLRSLIASQPDMKVVAEASNGREALEKALEVIPDLVLMDVMMPELNGIEATRKIIEKMPETRILALSMYDDRRYVSEMLKAGARGFILKDCAFRELAEAIRHVSGGNYYLSDPISEAVLEDYVMKLAAHEEEGPLSSLTDREREVFQMLAEGMSTREISEVLMLSNKTVETHRYRLMQKLGMESLAELTRYAIKQGVISIDG